MIDHPYLEACTDLRLAREEVAALKAEVERLELENKELRTTAELLSRVCSEQTPYDDGYKDGYNDGYEAAKRKGDFK